MLIVDSKQMSSLKDASDERFVQSAVEHLQRYDPLAVQAASPEALEAIARSGIERAHAHGFIAARHVRLFLELMVSLGAGFDTDPQYEWLRPYLQEMPGVLTSERARLLQWHATIFLDRVYGEDAAHGIAALRRVSVLDQRALPETGGSFLARGPQFIENIHPERMDFLDEVAIGRLLQQAQIDAPRLGLALPAGPPLLLLLMFGFGHQAADDPLHPWISRTLTSAEPRGQAKVDHLFERTKTYAAIMLEQIEKMRG